MPTVQCKHCFKLFIKISKPRLHVLLGRMIGTSAKNIHVFWKQRILLNTNFTINGGYFKLNIKFCSFGNKNYHLPLGSVHTVWLLDQFVVFGKLFEV